MEVREKTERLELERLGFFYSVLKMTSLIKLPLKFFSYFFMLKNNY